MSTYNFIPNVASLSLALEERDRDLEEALLELEDWKLKYKDLDSKITKVLGEAQGSLDFAFLKQVQNFVPTKITESLHKIVDICEGVEEL